MPLPLMPKATAVWLVENTTLTFEQIADFCGMHPLEVQGIADGEVAAGIIGLDPVASGQLAPGSIAEAEKDAAKRLLIADKARKYLQPKAKGAKYTPKARRQDKPDALAWLIKYHSYIPDSKVARLLGTTKKTIDAIRGKTHWNSNNLHPRDPVLLGLCTQVAMDELIRKFKPAEPDPAPEAEEASAQAS